MVDVEASSSTSNNPYSGADPNVLPLYHPINILWRLLYMTIALWGLHHFQAYETIIHSPKIRHEWFKIGLAATVAILFIKAYVELYAGKIQKKQVNYKNFKSVTHTVMTLLLLTSVSFHLSLWPAFGFKSFAVMFLVGMFILNFCLLMPTYIQNLTAFVLLTFFLQEYS